MVEMLITMIIIAAIFLAIGSVISNMIKTSNTVSSRMLIREEGEYLAEVFRKYLRNSSADNVRLYYRGNATITFDDYYGVSSLGGEALPPDVDMPATEIHFRPSGDATNKVVCMGFFKDGNKGYIVRTTNDLAGSWNNYEPETCFPEAPSSDQIFRKNFASLNSDLVYIEGLEIEQVRTATNVYYTIHIDMKPAWGLGGLSNYRDKDGAPKYRKSFVVQTRQLFYHAFRQRLGDIEIDEGSSPFDDSFFFEDFAIIPLNYFVRYGQSVVILTEGADGEAIRLECGKEDGNPDLCIGDFSLNSPRYCEFISEWEDTGLKTLYCRVFDGSETSGSDVVEVFSDNTPPTNPTLAPLFADWSSSNIEISVSDSVDVHSGLSHYEYCITGEGLECEPNVEAEEDKVVLEEDGEWKVCVVAVDNVGNRSSVICSEDFAYKIDKTEPSLSATLASPTWFCAARNPVISATDEGSGLDEVRYYFGLSSPFNSDCTVGGEITSNGVTLNSPSGGTTLYLCARDNAGNVSSWEGFYNWKSPAITPVAPTMASNTSDSIILNGISNGEYRRDGGAWQDSVTFTGLQPETTYSFTQRIKDEHCPSSESPSASLSTIGIEKADQSPPSTPTCVSSTANSITISTCTNCEYRRGTGNPQNSNIFTGLNSNTSYTFSRRYKETATHNASPWSANRTCSTLFVCGDNFTDTRNNQVYPTVQIGSQCWMAKNLNYPTSNSWCYGNNSANCTTYGRLYTPGAARSACPSGWSLPTDAQLHTLENYLCTTSCSGSRVCAYACAGAGTRLKTSSWGGNNQSGFTALGGGWRASNGTYRFLGHEGYFITRTASPYSGYYWEYALVSPSVNSTYHTHVVRCLGHVNDASSVRCIRN